jgi:hypothetical protein
MEKIFINSDEASYYQWLYNTFPCHVKATVKKNKLIYDYIPGEERYTLVQNKSALNSLLFKNLGRILWKFHFTNCEISSHYEMICANRGYIQDIETFHPSKYYFWTIHWDLHLRNVIISINKIYVLDRLSSTGDILFDFPFIMQLLCFWIMKQDREYITYITDFFSTYIEFISWSKDDFFIAFKNNFINYWLVCKEISKRRNDFPEREYGDVISNRLLHKRDFLQFIHDF